MGRESEIQKEAKSILLRFSKKLKTVTLKKAEETQEIGGFRTEGPGHDADPEFRKQLFANAPKTEGDFIIAEKKKW